MNTIKSALTKDDANKALDNINMWINNCDTKASVALAFYAAIITIIFSTDFFEILKNNITYCFDNICFLTILYIAFYFVSILAFVIGIIELLVVIIPKIVLRTGNEKCFKSVLFYGSIAKNTKTYDAYCTEVAKITDESILNDLLFQVHSSAIICNKKFLHHKIGLILTTVATIVFFIITVIGMIAF